MDSLDELQGMLQDETQPEETKMVTGNAIIAVAESKEQVLIELAKDVYATEGVWDMEKVSVTHRPLACTEFLCFGADECDRSRSLLLKVYFERVWVSEVGHILRMRVTTSLPTTLV